MRRGKRTRSIALLLGATLLLTSCAAGSPYAYSPGYDCAGCYGYPGFYGSDFDHHFYHHHYYYYHGTPDHGFGHGGFGHGGGHGGGHR